MKIEGIKIEEKKLGREKMHGYTFLDKIVIDPRLKPKKKMEIFIHEMLHQLFPDASETQIKIKARKLQRFLWALGYRKIEE